MSKKKKVTKKGQFDQSKPLASVVPLFQEKGSVLEEDGILEQLQEFLQGRASFRNASLMAGREPEEDKLYWEAMEAEGDRRLVLLEELVTKYPDYLDGHLQRMVHQDLSLSASYLSQLEALYARALTAWKAIDYGCWYHIEARPALRALHFILSSYLKLGLISRAEQVVSLINSQLDDGFPPGFDISKLSVYNSLYQLEAIEEHYENCLAEDFEDDQSLVHLVIAYVLQGEFAVAEELFADLARINQDTVNFFSFPYWAYLLEEVDEISYYSPRTADALRIALAPLADFLKSKPLLVKQLVSMAEAYEDSLPDSLRKRQEFFDSPAMAGIAPDKGHRFCDEGIMRLEDFAQWTEKDLLALPGIGQVTIKKLKENGVHFKEG